MNMMDYSRQFFLNARELEIVEELDKEPFFLNARELEIVENWIRRNSQHLIARSSSLIMAIIWRIVLRR